MLSVIQRLLMDDIPEIGSKAAEALANIAKILKEEDMGEHILTIVFGNFLYYKKDYHGIMIMM